LLKKEYFYKLWKKHKGNGRIEQDYKACRNGLLSMKRRKRKAYYSNILEKTDNISKDIWKVAKEVLYNKCKTKASHESVMNIYVYGVEAAAEETPGVFNNYFTSVVGQMLVGKKNSSEKDVNDYVDFLPKIYDNFYLEPTTEEEIEAYIDRLIKN